FFFFFFSSRRRHTRWPRDWSSDVCSSDLKLKTELDQLRVEVTKAERQQDYQRASELKYGRIPELERKLKSIEATDGRGAMVEEEIGRASGGKEWRARRRREKRKKSKKYNE